MSSLSVQPTTQFHVCVGVTTLRTLWYREESFKDDLIVNTPVNTAYQWFILRLSLTYLLEAHGFLNIGPRINYWARRIRKTFCEILRHEQGDQSKALHS